MRHVVPHGERLASYPAQLNYPTDPITRKRKLPGYLLMRQLKIDVLSVLVVTDKLEVEGFIPRANVRRILSPWNGRQLLGRRWSGEAAQPLLTEKEHPKPRAPREGGSPPRRLVSA